MPDVLKKAQVQRESFDPTNEAHLESLRSFIRTGNWGQIQFYCELPYNEVPMTVLMLYAEHCIGVKRETGTERTERMGTRTDLFRMPSQREAVKQDIEERRANLVRANELMSAALAGEREAA